MHYLKKWLGSGKKQSVPFNETDFVNYDYCWFN